MTPIRLWGIAKLRIAIVALLFAAALNPVPRATAATTPAAGAAAATVTTTPAAGNGVTTGQLQDLVKTLQDSTARAKLIGEIEALIAVQQAAAKSPPKPPPPAGFIANLAVRFHHVGTDFLDIVSIAQAAPRLVGWIEAQAASPAARLRWLGVLLHLIIIFGAATFVGIATARGLRGLRRRFGPRIGEHFAGWLVLFLATLVLELLPLALFGGVATLVLAILHPDLPARPLARVAIVAILKAQAILVFFRVGLISRAPHFLHLGAETRAYLYVWARRFVIWTVYGFAVPEMAWWLGAPGAIDVLLIRLVVLVLAGLAIVFVLQNRAAVAHFLRGGTARPPGQPPGRASPFRLVRNTLADSWHILAIVYIVGSFGTYLVDLRGGLGFVLRATVISIVILIGAGVALRLVRQMNQRGFALGPEMRARYPGLEGRANKYMPALVVIISLVVYAVAALLLLQAWGVDVAQWLAAYYVTRIAGAMASIVVVVVIAIVIWEATSAGIERALGGGDAGRQAQVSARLRTLLPLLRTTVLIAIVTIAAFTILAQIGVNIGPLLAGAGIVGIAIGLGSQALVKDLINGVFFLIENTITIGDWVDVGGGHVGAVEKISIRTMRLRDGSGGLHTIPFSSVTAVTNSNRGIGNAAVSVNVAFGEDTDRVARILAEIALAMRKEPAFKAAMLSDLQLWGVDHVDGAMVTVDGQIVCTDAGRWNVQREFNRRMMLRFQQEGIAIAMPTQAIVLRQGAEPRRSGTTPAAT